MIEESWVSIILKVISGTEAKERITSKAVAFIQRNPLVR